MKKNFVAFACMMFITLAGLVACGDDEASQEKKMDEVMTSEEDLDSVECVDKKEGWIVYLSESDSRMVCHNREWISYMDWLVAQKEEEKSSRIADDTVANYSNLPTCNYSRDEYVEYVKSLNINLMCVDGEWLEFALQSVPNSVSSISALPVCLPSISGAIVYLTSMKDYVICSEKEWVEYDLWLVQSSSSGNSSSSGKSSSSSYYSSSSSLSIRDATFGACTEKRDGELAYDTNGVIGSSSNDYYYCDGDYKYWEKAPTYMIDTLGWKSAADGTFKPGDYSYSRYYYEDLSEDCEFTGENGEIYYVYDGKSWREAAELEVCMLSACTKARKGETSKLGGYTFVCGDNGWNQDSLYTMGKVDRFNKSLTYGSLKDTRDNKVYKTIVIGSQTWMAEDLNFADSTLVPNLSGQSFCYGLLDTNCAIGGRSYRWAAAMNLASSYNSSSPSDSLIAGKHQGICPTGWHIPNNEEWSTLNTSAGKKAASLKAQGVWPYDEYIDPPTNSTGFTGLPSGNSSGSYNYGGNTYVFYCSSNNYSSSYAYMYELSYSSNQLYGDDVSKSSGCHVRCIKD